MGKYQSKQVPWKDDLSKRGESYLVSAQLNTFDGSFQDGYFIKNLVGTNLANYSSDQSSEVSFSSYKKVGLAEDRVALKVVLPPEKGSTETGKLLVMDQDLDLQLHLNEKTPSEKEREKSEKKSAISVEEIECGVSVEGTDKQEWSFTLYDFDGRGKITKEDLASLMKSLYDAVGTSIKLPSSGTKTLRLRLSVTPDSTKVKQKDTNKDKNKNCVKLNNLAKADKVSKELETDSSENNRVEGERKLSSSEQRHLVELVQKNMERHHLRQGGYLRRHHSDTRGPVGQSLHTCRQNRNIRDNTVHVESQDRRNYYLDLAGVENDSPHLLNTSAAPQAAAAADKHKAKTHHNNLKPKRMSRIDRTSSHQRSRSYELSRTNECKTGAAGVQKQCKLGKTFSSDEQESQRSKSYDPYQCWSPKVHHRKSSAAKAHRHKRHSTVPVNIEEDLSLSPHHQRRHRHREKDRTRAMNQVAQWIEREHLCDTSDQPTQHVIVQRHEHHHIHEHHHHHHYHHYHET